MTDVARATSGARDRRAFAVSALTGDFAAFLLFAALGRGQHGESRDAAETVVTALPFFVSWLGSATAAGLYCIRRQADLGRVARRTAFTWLAAWPFALALRAALQHRGIPLSFDIVALVVNCVLLVGWRATLNAAAPSLLKARAHD